MKRYPYRIVAILFSLLVTLPSMGDAAIYFFQQVDAPGSNGHTRLAGINDRGIIVGDYLDANAGRRFVFTLDSANVFTVFTTEPLTFSGDINNVGTIVGQDDFSSSFVRDSSGTLTFFSPFNSTSSHGRGINDAGYIVGSFFVSPSTRAYLRDSYGNETLVDLGTVTLLHGINKQGISVGSSYYSPDSAFIRDIYGNTTFFSFPSSRPGTTVAQDINDLGIVVGHFVRDSQGRSRGFRRDGNGQLTAIDFPGAHSTYVLGINNSGILVGSILHADSSSSGFIARPITPTQATRNLINRIFEAGLPKGTEYRLVGNLKLVEEILDDGNPKNDQEACKKLDIHLKIVSKEERAGNLTSMQAEDYRQAAREIRAEIGC